MKMIVIKNMEMPKNCKECKLRNSSYCAVNFINGKFEFLNIEKFVENEEKSKDCPLEEIEVKDESSSN